MVTSKRFSLSLGKRVTLKHNESKNMIPELPKPNQVDVAERAMELARIWIVDGNQQIVIADTYNDDSEYERPPSSDRWRCETVWVQQAAMYLVSAPPRYD